MRQRSDTLNGGMCRFGWLVGIGVAATLAATPVLAADEGVRPTGTNGRALNLDFESGNLDGWISEGDAFEGQPVKGDTVARRRADMKSGHTGEYWVGTYELGGDAPKGTLTSAAFEATHPWASYLVSGGAHATTRVELVTADDDKVFHTSRGENGETLKTAVVDLRKLQGRRVYIRLIDDHSGGWGHIGFDDFRFHDERPNVSNEQLVAEFDEIENEGLSPEEAARAMTLPDGFKATLSAGEPDVKQPIAMAIDDRGRVWVAEAYSYPKHVPEDEARDRILIFTDDDGDGRFDSRKVFAEGLNLVSGIEVGFGGVWVGAAPNFLFIPDADGDDRPDGPPQVLLDGWGYQDTHETLNAFIWGPDGWLYGCHGVFTHSRVGKPGTPDDERVPLNAAIWRYHPTRHEFDIFAHGTSNPWGVDFNDHGQSFLTCCVIPHLFHVIDGARYRRQSGSHFNPHTYDDIKTIAVHRHWRGATPHMGNGRSNSAGGGHAHCGAMIYLGDAWPQEYRGQIFMNNIHGARLNVDQVARSGSGYSGDRSPDFLLANDVWSQIMNIRYGPDGNAWMIDWYDANQCHHHRTEDHDRSNGRVFKITYGDVQPVDVDVKSLSNAELVKLQLHKNDWYVRHARRVLQERGPNREVHDALAKIAFGHEDETRRLRGLWALHVTGGLNEPLVARGLRDENPWIRAWTIQLAHEDGQFTSSELARLTEMARSDDSQVVRLYLSSAVGKLNAEARWEILDGLVSHGEDADDHNLPLMYWYALEPLVPQDPARALRIATAGEISLLRSYVPRRIGADATVAGMQAVVDAVASSDDAVRLELLSGLDAGLAGRRQVEMPEGWLAVRESLYASNLGSLGSIARKLAVTFGDPDALAELRELVGDRDADDGNRRRAITTLVGVKDAKLVPVLQQLLDDPALCRDALRALGAFDDDATPERVLAVYPALDLFGRRDALNTLASRVSYSHQLLDAVAAEKVATADITADVVRQLRNLRDDELEQRIRDVWGTVRDTSQAKAEQIEKVRKLVDRHKKQADVSLGRAVFAKTCQQCHKLFGTGDDIGPELTGSNRADIKYLLDNVVDPSALIAKDYVATVFITDDGRTLTGLIRNETDQAVTVVTANEEVVIPKDEIEERQASAASMMPDDLLATLSERRHRFASRLSGQPPAGADVGDRRKRGHAV